MSRKQWAHPRRRLVCGACGAGLGYAYLREQTGDVIVVDRDENGVPPTRGADRLDEARDRVRRLAQRAEDVALDQAHAAADPAGWQQDVDLTRAAVRDAIADVQWLTGATDLVTYELRCKCGATPRRTADTLARELREDDGVSLRLT